MQLSSEKKIQDMRSVYADTLVELGQSCHELVCVGADTTDSIKTKKFEIDTLIECLMWA